MWWLRLLQCGICYGLRCLALSWPRSISMSRTSQLAELVRAVRAVRTTRKGATLAKDSMASILKGSFLLWPCASAGLLMGCACCALPS